MSDLCFVLGAPDPEMEAIENLLRSRGVGFVYALDQMGRRVRPETAYACEPWILASHYVECCPDCSRWAEHEVKFKRIDHHRPGDPGYGKPPSEFFYASSLGQVIAVLFKHVGLSTTSREERLEQLYVAAADHCLAAAYRGECPGVDPQELMAWRAASRAKFQERSAEDVLADVEKARVMLREAELVCLNPASFRPHTCDHDWSTSVCDGCGVEDLFARDMRRHRVPELPEASAREGECFVGEGLPGPDGRVKVVCQSGSSEQIDAFMTCFAEANNLVDVYGDPARGFAGGYLASK